MADERHVVVREVGPRDGLQSLSTLLPTTVKVDLITELAGSGFQRAEIGSFVGARAVPQMADSDVVFKQTAGLRTIAREALVVNRRGAARAVEAGADTIVLVVATTDSFSMANVRMTVAEAIVEAEAIRNVAVAASIPVVADVATAFGCAYEGMVPTESVLRIVSRLAEIGLTEITLADTTGMASPPDVSRVIEAIRSYDMQGVDLGLHFHNTRGLGLANVWVGLDLGVRLFDSSLGGLGGCPYSPGATGNIATEDLVHLLATSGYETGIDLTKLIDISREFERLLGFQLPGQLLRSGPRWITKGSRA